MEKVKNTSNFLKTAKTMVNYVFYEKISAFILQVIFLL